MAQTTISPEFESDADRDWHSMRPLDLVCISGDGLLHPERRITSAHGMILVGERRAEEGHDPVAHDPVHRALVAMHGLDHALEDGVEELLCLLGVAVGKQLHRTLDVGEQHRDLLPLALDGCPGGEDPICEVLGGVALGRGEAWIASGWNQKTGTLRAELGCGRYLAPAIRTGTCQRRGTLLAELRPGAVLVLAPWTLHDHPWAI